MGRCLHFPKTIAHRSHYRLSLVNDLVPRVDCIIETDELR
jgi:hypothetical protein